VNAGLARLATACRTVAAAALVVAAAGVGVRIVASAFDPFHAYPGHASDYGVARTRAIRAALPDIADHPQKTVIVIGSSGVARAFVPASFDATFDGGRGLTTSFNLGQVLLQPETALALSKDIRKTYEARSRRIGIAIVGISVPELLRGSVRAAKQKMPDQAFAFTTADDLEERAHIDPRGAFDDGTERLLFGDVRRERVGLWVQDWWAARRPPCDSGFKQPPEGEEAMSALVAYCNDLHSQFPRGVPPWNTSTRGAFDFGLPSTRPMLQRLVELAPKQPMPAPHADASSHVAHAASIPADIDDEDIRTMIAAVREIGAVSDHLFVLDDIMNPASLAALPPELVAQWRAIAERIAHEGGAPLLDFNDGTLVPADFGDRTHLHALAAQRFSSLLAARIQPLVGEHRASR
jgi:hypothetical protein